MTKPAAFPKAKFDAATREMLRGVERTLGALWDDPQTRKEARAAMRPVQRRAQQYGRGNMKRFIAVRLAARRGLKRVARGTAAVIVRVGYRLPKPPPQITRPGHTRPTPAVRFPQLMAAEWGNKARRGIGATPPRALQRSAEEEGPAVLNELSRVVDKGVARTLRKYVPQRIEVR